eukprot:147743_1
MANYLVMKLNATAAGMSVMSSVFKFIVAAAHEILFIRGIYPEESFKLTRKYSTSVHRNFHPKLCKYLEQILAQLQSCFVKNSTNTIVIAIFTDSDDTEILQERFAFKIKLHENQSRSVNVDLDRIFSDFIMRIDFCPSLLKPLPKGSHFKLLLETTQRPGGDHRDLAACDIGPLQFQSGQMVIHPLKTVVEPELFELSLAVEERVH